MSLSGGLDSTYLLYKLLQENKDVFIFHSIIIKPHYKYYDQELECTKKIIKYCKKNCKGKIIDVKYPVIDFRKFPIHYDLDTIFLLAQKYCSTISTEYPLYNKIKFCVGIIGDDDPLTSSRKKIKNGLNQTL
jgi:tRNA(Ile)-lysidine synthase TilS/MesJ